MYYDSHRHISVAVPAQQPAQQHRGMLFLLAAAHIGVIVTHHYMAIAAAWFLMNTTLYLPKDLGGGVMAMLFFDLGLFRVCTSSDQQKSWGCVDEPECGGLCGSWTAIRTMVWISSALSYVAALGLLYLLIRGLVSAGRFSILCTAIFALTSALVMTFLLITASTLPPKIRDDFAYLATIQPSRTVADPLTVTIGKSYYADMAVALIEFGIAGALVWLWRSTPVLQ